MPFVLLADVDVTLPLSVLIAAAGVLASVLGSYYSTRSKLDALTTKVTEIANANAANAQGVLVEQSARKDLDKAISLVAKDVEHLKESQANAVPFGEFNARMDGQDSVLDQIAQRLNAGARSYSSAMRAADPMRRDTPPESPVPPPIGPMRRRMPSTRGGE